VARIVGKAPVAWRPVGGGYTPAARWQVDLGGFSVFVKAATNGLTARMLRSEIRVYDSVAAPFLPLYYGTDDDGSAPLIVIEDLSEARWPPPWDDRLVDAVVETLAQVHGIGAPQGLAPPPAAAAGWKTVAEDPRPFLALGIASPEWLEQCLGDLVSAEAACRAEGGALTHFDVRSDNLCLAAGGLKLVDWAEARAGNPKLDLGFWLPSLACEGGPLPETILPDAPEVAAWVAGYFAARAGLPEIADAPRVRSVQRAQLSTALPWAVRALRLPPP
jgi:hypothetical protein